MWMVDKVWTSSKIFKHLCVNINISMVCVRMDTFARSSRQHGTISMICGRVAFSHVTVQSKQKTCWSWERYRAPHECPCNATSTGVRWRSSVWWSFIYLDNSWMDERRDCDIQTRDTGCSRRVRRCDLCSTMNSLHTGPAPSVSMKPRDWTWDSYSRTPPARFLNVSAMLLMWL